MDRSKMLFRIVEHRDFFIVQHKKCFTEITGYLWWKKTTITERWITAHKSDEYMTTIYFNTFESAKKYIDDYFKYPIYHNID